MRRSLVVALVVGLVAALSVAPADAAKKKKRKPPAPKRIERVVEFEYECPCTGRIQLGSLTGGDPNLGGGPVALGADELYLRAEASDTSGQAVPVAINQDTNGDGLNDRVGQFCGATEEPITLGDEREMRIFVGDPAICPGPALGGTITFTLSNLP